MGNRTRKTGLLLVIIGATFWGVGGTVAQKLFQEYGIHVNWLVSVRLLIAGFLLLAIHFLRQSRSQIFMIWKNRKTAIQLLVFGLFGMLAVQYTYMASINHGNAAVATLLQYLAPVMIIIYFVLRHRTLPTRRELITVALALIGCFFLLTNGSVAELSVSLPAIIWGLLSGIALAFYTLYAVPLLAKYDSLVVVGWAMLIGGFALSFSHAPWQIDVTNFSLSVWLYIIFVILFGTMIAFWFYIESLQSLLPQEASLLGSLEPLSAVLTTVLWLHEPYGLFQWIGTACIIGMTLLLVLKKDSSENIH